VYRIQKVPIFSPFLNFWSIFDFLIHFRLFRSLKVRPALSFCHLMYIKWQKDSAGRTFKLRKSLKWIKKSKIDQKFKNGEKIGTFWIRYTNGSEPFCTVAETPILIGFDDLAFLYCILEGFQIWKSENWKSENRKILASGFFRNLSKSIPQAGGAP